MAGETRYRVYAIELGTYPNSTNEQCAVYVGSTSKTASERFQAHMEGGITSSRRVRRYGTKLLPDLVRGLRTFRTRAAAEAAEVRLAERLRSRGYRVFGGTGKRVLDELDVR